MWLHIQLILMHHILKFVYNYINYKRVLHLLLIVSVNALFYFTYYYCNYKYIKNIDEPTDVELKNWWTTRMNLYAVTFLILNLAQYLPKHKYSYFWMFFLCGLSVSDIIDRLYFNTNKFTREDIAMLIVNFGISLVMSTKVRKYFILQKL